MDVCSIDMEQLAHGMWGIVYTLGSVTAALVLFFVIAVVISIKLGYMKW